MHTHSRTHNIHNGFSHGREGFQAVLNALSLSLLSFSLSPSPYRLHVLGPGFDLMLQIKSFGGRELAEQSEVELLNWRAL